MKQNVESLAIKFLTELVFFKKKVFDRTSRESQAQHAASIRLDEH